MFGPTASNRGRATSSFSIGKRLLARVLRCNWSEWELSEAWQGCPELESFGGPRRSAGSTFSSLEPARHQVLLCGCFADVRLSPRGLLTLIDLPLVIVDVGGLRSFLFVSRYMYFSAFLVVARPFLGGMIAGSYVVAGIAGWLMR